MANRTCKIIAKIENCEIRKAEHKIGKFTKKDGTEVEYHFTDLSCDTEDCERIYLRDKDLSRTYQRGQVGTFTVIIESEETYNSKCDLYNSPKATLYIKSFD